MARFSVKQSFKITSRPGLVIAGDILEGVIKIRQFALFKYQGETYQKEIIGVEMMDFNIGRPNFFALVALVLEDKEGLFDPRKVEEQEVVIIDRAF